MCGDVARMRAAVFALEVLIGPERIGPGGAELGWEQLIAFEILAQCQYG